VLLLLGCKYLYEEKLAAEEPATDNIEQVAAPSSSATESETVPAKPAKDESAPIAKKSKYKTLREGWAELPAEVEHDDLYTTYHMCDDSRRNYTVCYSSEHRCPVWVASPMHPSYKGEAPRSDAFIFDPTLPMDIQPLLRRSYGEYTRGHLVGSAERTTSEQANRQTFYASNIAPQLQVGFNAANGAWNNWERFADKQSCADTLYVVTGCLFGDYADASGLEVKATTTVNKNDGEKVGVPTAYYKVLLRTRSGKTGRSVRECKADELKCAAFVVGHYSAKGRKPTAADMMSVEELERLTGFTFFANVPNAPKGKANAADWGL
jgi:DNA/RNA endonuclease G (NUC1)